MLNTRTSNNDLVIYSSATRMLSTLPAVVGLESAGYRVAEFGLAEVRGPAIGAGRRRRSAQHRCNVIRLSARQRNAAARAWLAVEPCAVAAEIESAGIHIDGDADHIIVLDIVAALERHGRSTRGNERG